MPLRTKQEASDSERNRLTERKERAGEVAGVNFTPWLSLFGLFSEKQQTRGEEERRRLEKNKQKERRREQIKLFNKNKSERFCFLFFCSVCR